MKCLQIVGNSAYGGATYLILEWCRFLVAKGNQVDVLATDNTTVERLRSLRGVRTIEGVVIPREIDPLKDAAALRRLYKLIRAERYDVVHTYTATPGILGRIAGRIAGVPVIVHHQAAWSATEASSAIVRFFYGLIEGVALAASTKTICVGRAVEEEGRRAWFVLKSRLATIVNGINPSPFLGERSCSDRTLTRRALGLTEHHAVVGNTGRLSPMKDNLTLIRALPMISDAVRGRPVALVLAGTGPSGPQLQEAAHALGCSNRVRFIGFCDDIPRFLNSLDVFATLSLREGLSISMLEAMAAARPIVASDIPPHSELIDHGSTGLLVQPRRPEQAAAAILKLLGNPELGKAMGTQARQAVLSRYTLDRMLEETWQLYISLLNRGGGVAENERKILAKQL